jgi:hypothetical protein
VEGRLRPLRHLACDRAHRRWEYALAVMAWRLSGRGGATEAFAATRVPTRPSMPKPWPPSKMNYRAQTDGPALSSRD